MNTIQKLHKNNTNNMKTIQNKYNMKTIQSNKNTNNKKPIDTTFKYYEHHTTTIQTQYK